MQNDFNEKAKEELIRHVNPLGVCDGEYLFYPKNLKVVKAYSATAIMQKANLFSIIGPALLYKYFPLEKEDQETGEIKIAGIKIQEAGLFLMSECHKKGKYDPDLMRGVGVWRDKDRIVVNNGAKLFVDGVPTHYDKINSRYTYDQPDKAYFDIGEACSDEEIQQLFKMIQRFNWIDEYAPYVLLGTLVQAVIGTIFKWRAHVWIIGAQGSGKSFIQFNLIRPLLGVLCLGMEHGSTAAGIKGKLEHNAFTISYDEAEIREGDDPRIIQSVVGLARISSSEESTVVKGTSSGGFNEYRCQSTFIMSSIKPTLKQESDLARFAQLEIEPPCRSDEDEAVQFAEVEEYCMNVLTESFSERWINKCISSIPEILVKKEEIALKMASMGLSPRTRQQFAHVIACCAVILGREIDLEMFSSVLDETRELTADAEPLRELNRLLGSEIRIPTNYGGENATILEAISILNKLQHPKYGFQDKEMSGRYDLDRLFEFLCSYGIKVMDGDVYIANNSSKIQKLLGYTNWAKLFKIIDWVEASENTASFGGRTYKSRYVKFSFISLNDAPPDETGFDERKSLPDVGF